MPKAICISENGIGSAATALRWHEGGVPSAEQPCSKLSVAARFSLTLTQWLLMCFSVMSRNRDPATTSICMHSAPAAWLDVSAPFFSPSPPAAVQFLTIGSNNSFSPTSSSSFQDSRLDCLLDMQSPPDPDSPSSRCGRRGLEFPQ